jgi:hypothetical protein
LTPPPGPHRAATGLRIRTTRFDKVGFVEIHGKLRTANGAVCNVGHKNVVLYRSKHKKGGGKRVATTKTKSKGGYAFTEVFPKFRFWHVEFHGSAGCFPSQSKHVGIGGV